MIDNKYNPSEIEEKWYKKWEDNKIFSPSGDGSAYCIMIPPPNVTGTLHMGHSFSHCQNPLDMLRFLIRSKVA